MKLRASAFLQLACVIHVQVSGFLENKNIPNHRCIEKRDPGPCRAAKLRWYFDTTTLQCKEFTYGGCKGNNNRFFSEAECKYACSSLIGIKNTTTTCMQKPDTGPCRAYLLNWYFDIIDGVCKLFVYGGCQGNNNRFDSELQCQASCAPTSKDQGICSMDSKQEPCNARAQLWYFDHVENTCHRFPPGICGSSANKFPTCRKCMRRCSGADGHKECSLAYRKIHYRKFGIYWPGKMEPRVRGPGIPLPNHPGAQMPQISVPGGTGSMPGGYGIPSPTIKTPTVTHTAQGVNGHAGTGLRPLVPSRGRPSTVEPGLTGEGITGSMSSGSGLAATTQGRHTSLGNGIRETIISRPGTTGAGQAGSVLLRPQTSPIKPGVGGNGLYPSVTETHVVSQVQPGVGLPGPTMAPFPSGTNPTRPSLPGLGSGPSLTATGPSIPGLSEPRIPVAPSEGTVRLTPTRVRHNQGAFPERGSDLKTPPLTVPEDLLAALKRVYSPRGE